MLLSRGSALNAEMRPMTWAYGSECEDGQHVRGLMIPAEPTSATTTASGSDPHGMAYKKSGGRPRNSAIWPAGRIGTTSP